MNLDRDLRREKKSSGQCETISAYNSLIFSFPFPLPTQIQDLNTGLICPRNQLTTAMLCTLNPQVLSLEIAGHNKPLTIKKKKKKKKKVVKRKQERKEQKVLAPSLVH
ncbi:unnamed protein product [Camellia sinensis]